MSQNRKWGHKIKKEGKKKNGGRWGRGGERERDLQRVITKLTDLEKKILKRI